MITEARDPDLVNPNWVRPPDWRFEMDFGSPAWRRKMLLHYDKLQARRNRYGFGCCPECGVQHTTRTLVCRGCGYKAKIDD